MTLYHTINKPAIQVFDCLTNMQQFASVHPVITSIQSNDDGGYRVQETLKVGFIPVSFSYPATVQSYPLENKVIMRAVVGRFTNIVMTFRLKTDRGVTVVEEDISISSPLPIITVLELIFKRQHLQLFKNIDAATCEKERLSGVE